MSVQLVKIPPLPRPVNILNLNRRGPNHKFFTIKFAELDFDFLPTLLGFH